MPDTWEHPVLDDFDRRRAAGESPANIEAVGIVSAGKQRLLRYMKALPTQALCLNCHGDETQLAPEVKARLAELYPDDRATRYSEGQIRSALTVKRRL